MCRFKRDIFTRWRLAAYRDKVGEKIKKRAFSRRISSKNHMLTTNRHDIHVCLSNILYLRRRLETRDTTQYRMMVIGSAQAGRARKGQKQTPETLCFFLSWLSSTRQLNLASIVLALLAPFPTHLSFFHSICLCFQISISILTVVTIYGVLVARGRFSSQY